MHRFFKKFLEYFENAIYIIACLRQKSCYCNCIITKTFSASYLDLTHLKRMCNVL